MRYQLLNADMTDIKRLEHDLIIGKEQSEFYLDLMTHDMRNLNQIALGYQELLINSSKLDDSSKS